MTAGKSQPDPNTGSQKLRLVTSGRKPSTGKRNQKRPATKKPVTTKRARPADTTARIVASISNAIVEHRLMPGAKLAEQKLADLFKVSRTIVRQALNQLSRDGLVTLQSARGAFVATPGVREAREVFEVRIMLETAMIRALSRVITPEQIQALRTHLEAEQQALANPDVAGRTRLLADFHVVLANTLGNAVLADQLRELLSRSSLIMLMYQSKLAASHSSDEHVGIVDALEQGDGRKAARLMEQHIRHVEKNLQLEPRSGDLAQALAPSLQEYSA